LNHVSAVKDRIDQVSNLKDVVPTTKALFEISKETAALEAESFELKQKVNVATESKSVLDSWNRYEAQVRQLEQEQLSSSVISKVQAALADSKLQDKVLAQAVSDVEKLFAKEK
jgi:F-type H+-transporting ATPase subunit b